jgi:hypothetical protein
VEIYIFLRPIVISVMTFYETLDIQKLNGGAYHTQHVSPYFSGTKFFDNQHLMLTL